jgi:hypothetical protein
MAGEARLRVDALYWTSAELELLPCQSAWRRAADWLLPPAHAHGESTPTLMAVPTIESAAATSEIALGELRPPAGAYCGLRYRIAPADADALGASESPDMLGRSLLLRGGLGSAGGELEPFALASSLSFDVERTVSFELSQARPEVTLHLVRDTAAAFETIQLDVLDAFARDKALLESFVASLTIEVR